MPSLVQLISRLEESKRQFGVDHGARTERLLAQLGKRRFRDVDYLIRFHEALLFIRARPESGSGFRSAEKLLSTFSQRVEFLKQSGVDLTPTDYIENSGIAGTVVSGSFSYDITRHLVKRHSPA